MDSELEDDECVFDASGLEELTENPQLLNSAFIKEVRS